MRNTVYLSIPLMFFLTILQLGILDRILILGFTPQWPFLFALAWGMIRDAEEGAVWCFVAGILMGLFTVAPIGILPLAYLVPSVLVIWGARLVENGRFFLPILQTLLATVGMLLLQFLLLRLFQFPIPIGDFIAQLPLAILHSVLILPVYALLNWFSEQIQPRPIQF